MSICWKVIKGAAVALVLEVLGAGLTFLFNMVLARALGAEGAGIYFLAITVNTIATVFDRMGLDNTLLRLRLQTLLLMTEAQSKVFI
ncbi:oligosaccharide flippase family protein [Prosthecochloris sp. SCSIO W1101]|uniref:oligosaccharide flippase family protein n=1 Tax=Prosthecochloris sp. SCSIO W1101 TaxID=2992242 RepID=UPI00223D1468|nr:oligosaccharide flippase family protein [Prosthecochloris sp. SCSIO W1101]UZJ41942.1 oligosaccharide flippase family protein [Prosthecochloris sp. SCSIO W1101]